MNMPAGGLARWLRPVRQPGLLLGFIGLLACSGTPVQSGTPERLDPDTEIAPFVNDMVSRHGFESDQLERILGGVRVRPDILEAIQRPAESLDWYQYRPIFLTESRIAKGEQFWRAHAKTLDEASRKYGVSPEIIVAIIGVETFYGTRKASTWYWIPCRRSHFVTPSAASSSSASSRSSWFFPDRRALIRRR